MSFSLHCHFLYFSYLFFFPLSLLLLRCFAAVRANFWARVLCSLAAEEACFRMRITLGVVLIRSLIFHVCVSECSRNGSWSASASVGSREIVPQKLSEGKDWRD